MARPCRYGNLLHAARLLADQEPEYVHCTEVAAYTAIVGTSDDGFVIEISTPLCDVHEALVVHNPGYKRSIKLRPTT